MNEGLYKASFRTPRDNGTGVVALVGGKVRGGDDAMYYNGDYKLEGDVFTAMVHVNRHTNGNPSVFGIDKVTISLKGKVAGDKIEASGTAKEAPGATLQATLNKLAD